MSDDAIPLRSLLSDMRQSLDDAVEVSRGEREPGSLVDQFWPVVSGEACHALDDALSDDLIGLLVDAWSKADELKGYAGDKYPRDKRVLVTLAEAKAAVAVDPELQLVVGEIRKRLPLTVEFLATLETGALTIKAGEIVGVGLGKLTLDAKLKWGEHEIPLGLKAREIPLSGTRTLNPAIPLRARSHGGA